MENIPLQWCLFGLADQIAEPFCYGCAGFVLTYRVGRSLPARLIFIAMTILCFLWMDDIWPAIGSRSAKMAMSSEDPTVAYLFSERQQLGHAEFNSGRRSGLWDIFKLDTGDIGSAIVFIPLAFYIGRRLTSHQLHEITAAHLPPPPPGRGSRPPPPPI